jgi:hypothetical protein
MAHVFDLADNWPADHVSIIVQGWYTIPTDGGGVGAGDPGQAGLKPGRAQRHTPKKVERVTL